MQNSPSYLPILDRLLCIMRSQQVIEKNCHIKLKRMEGNKQTHATCRKKMTRELTTDVWRGLRWIEVRIREFEISLAWHRTTRPQATNYTPHCWKGNVSRSHTLFISPNTHCTFLSAPQHCFSFFLLLLLQLSHSGLSFYNSIML